MPTFQTIINTYITQDNVPPLPPQSMLSHRQSITTQSKKLQALVQLHGILNEPYFEWSFWMILFIYQNNLDCGGRGDMGEINNRLILCVYNHTDVCKVIYHHFRHESRFGKDILKMIVWKMKNREKGSFDIDMIQCFFWDKQQYLWALCCVDKSTFDISVPFLTLIGDNKF